MILLVMPISISRIVYVLFFVVLVFAKIFSRQKKYNDEDEEA